MTTTTTTIQMAQQQFPPIDRHEINNLVQRFPSFELPYETVKAKYTKQSTTTNSVCLFIQRPPIMTTGVADNTNTTTGYEKCYLWISYDNENPAVFFLVFMNRKNHTITNIKKWKIPTATTATNSGACVGGVGNYPLGTIFYGTLINGSNFVIEDILYNKGIDISQNTCFGKKLGYIYAFLQQFCGYNTNCAVSLVKMEFVPSNNMRYVFRGNEDAIGKVIYKSLTDIQPYIVVYPPPTSINNQTADDAPDNNAHATTKTATYLSAVPPSLPKNLHKSQYRHPTVFMIMANERSDIYTMFVGAGVDAPPIYYDYLYLPTYASSVFMNSIFRRIRENENIDYIEESEDEEEFENVHPTKNVFLKKRILMECVFSFKMKQWIPTDHAVASDANIVNIGLL